MKQGECVCIPDGRIGRLRDINGDRCIVRVRRRTSKTQQLLTFQRSELKVVACPSGWMSPEGYNRYLEVTLAKLKKRLAKKKNYGK